MQTNRFLFLLKRGLDLASVVLMVIIMCARIEDNGKSSFLLSLVSNHNTVLTICCFFLIIRLCLNTFAKWDKRKTRGA